MARSGLNEVLELVAPEIPEETTGVVDEPDDIIGFKMAANQCPVVPKKVGPLWKERIEKSLKASEGEHAKWDAVFNLYRKCGIEEGLDTDIEYRYHNTNDTDENLIRASVNTLIRSTYMQNPHIELTETNTKDSDFTGILEDLIELLMSKKTAPGLNIKPKARRWLLHSTMTNFGVLKIDYQEKAGSMDAAQEELHKLEEAFRKAKTNEQIEESYASLQLLYETMPVLETKGIQVKNTLPHRLIVDPNCTQVDLSDAWWCAEEIYLDEEYIETKFFTEGKDGDKVFLSNTSVKSGAVLRDNDRDAKDEILDRVMNDTSDERREVIMENKIKCYYVYDKYTRRILLYSDRNWRQPLWVFEDELKLSRFFPFFILSIGENIDGIVQPGEVSQIVGPTKEINKINRKAQQIRDSVFGAMIYNKKMIAKEDVEKLVKHLNNPNEVKAFGVGMDADLDLTKALQAFAPPAFNHKELFDTTALRKAVDNATSQNEVARGQQFKTNTTNDQVQYYEQQTAMQNSAVTDIVEEAFEELGWALCEIIVSKFSTDDVVALLGQEKARGFQSMTVQEFNQRYHMQVAAGSIEKPTSQFKRKEAMAIAQALGQIGQGAPMTTMSLIIRMFEGAFTNFNVRKEDWDALKQEGQANLQKGISANGPQTQQPPAAAQHTAGPAGRGQQ